jgi:phage shock protein C
VPRLPGLVTRPGSFVVRDPSKAAAAVHLSTDDVPRRRCYTQHNIALRSQTMNTTTNRLYRSQTDRMLAGVCGGLARYFNIDPTVVRLVFVVLALAGGPGVLLYLLLWIITPIEP